MRIRGVFGRVEKRFPGPEKFTRKEPRKVFGQGKFSGLLRNARQGRVVQSPIIIIRWLQRDINKSNIIFCKFAFEFEFDFAFEFEFEFDFAFEFEFEFDFAFEFEFGRAFLKRPENFSGPETAPQSSRNDFRVFLKAPENF